MPDTNIVDTFAGEVNDPNNTNAVGIGFASTNSRLSINDGGTIYSVDVTNLPAVGTSGATPIRSSSRTFTETSGSGVYTGSVVLPAGATILDIIIDGVALWNNAGTASLKVGDTDDDGYYTGVDLKATDLLAGESLSFALAGGKGGAYIANSQVSPRYNAATVTIAGIITTSSTGGSTGRTRMTVVWSLPATANIIAATKV